MTLEKFYVPHPERWWFARRGDMPWLTDPDKDDGRVRHEDRNERNWPAIARVIHAAARAIAHLADGEDHIEVDLTALGTNADLGIAESWFTNGCEPRADFRDEKLTDGRHRLWSTWEEAPDAVLPIYSAVLALSDNAGADQDAAEVLRKLPQELTKENPRYVDELLRVARRDGHDVVDPLELMP